jgi:hypothetical protein
MPCIVSRRSHLYGGAAVVSTEGLRSYLRLGSWERLPPFAPLWRCGGCKHGGAAFIFASRQLGATVGGAAVLRDAVTGALVRWFGPHVGLRSFTVRVGGRRPRSTVGYADMALRRAARSEWDVRGHPATGRGCGRRDFSSCTGNLFPGRPRRAPRRDNRAGVRFAVSVVCGIACPFDVRCCIPCRECRTVSTVVQHTRQPCPTARSARRVRRGSTPRPSPSRPSPRSPHWTPGAAGP